MEETPGQDTAVGAGDDSRYRRLVQGIKDYAIFLLDAQGRVCSWNQGAEHIKGYTQAEVLGKSLEIFYSREALEAGLPAQELAQAKATGSYEVEGWRLRKDGSRFWASVMITALFDKAGQLEGYAKVTKDLTERRRQDERFRRVAESAPSAMVMVNAHGHIVMVNALVERLFGYKRAEMLGQPIEMLVPDRFRKAHPKLRQGFFEALQSRPMGEGRDLFARRKDGSEFPVEIGLNPIETEEGTMVLSAIVDISDRKQKEARIQAALQEKDLLLGEIHHRVKNNLQIVHSLLDLQSARISDATVQEMLLDSQNRIRSMALIHQTLYQSKDFARVDFEAFLESLVPVLSASYSVDPQAIRLRVDAGAVFLPINQAIPCGLLLNELITNALKHGFPHGRSGEVWVTLVHLDEGRIQLTVCDDGVGIPDAQPIDGEDTLGLSLISLLSRQLGGKLTIERRQPTRFTLEFSVTSR